ncbi:MAG: DUF5677 domain-containing protein [Bacilli bacterium]
MDNNTITLEQFNKVLSSLHVDSRIKSENVFAIFNKTLDIVKEVQTTNIVTKIESFSPIELILYSLGEYIYRVPLSKQQQFVEDEEMISSIATTVVDKYLSLSIFGNVETKLTNKYLPPISTMKVYLNFLLNVLNHYDRNDPKYTLLNDLLLKSTSIANCILDLLTNGHETEAFSCWRTLHECECTLIILNKYKNENILDRYLLHMKYGYAFKNGLSSEEETDQIFVEIKENLKAHNLKSKDMKKYIEYGWIYAIKEVEDNFTNYKLNFRDTIESLAGLSSYNKRYELSSEIIHSTPILIYSNKEYFYHLTLLSLYESFFRLEKVFIDIFLKKVNQESIDKYKELRKVYYSSLLSIYRKEVELFKVFQNNKMKK